MSTAVRASETQYRRTPQHGVALRDRERLEQIRARVAEQIGSLEALIAAAAADAAERSAEDRQRLGRAELKLRLLKQLERELPHLYPQELPADAAGLGSLLTLEDCSTGECLECILMSGSDIDVAAGQVSLGSPIGQAVLGLRPGAVVEVMLPRGRRSFRIAALTTLPALVGVVHRSGPTGPHRRAGKRAPLPGSVRGAP